MYAAHRGDTEVFELLLTEGKPNISAADKSGMPAVHVAVPEVGAVRVWVCVCVCGWVCGCVCVCGVVWEGVCVSV